MSRAMRNAECGVRNGRSVIGRFVRVRHDRELYVANVLDTVAGEERLPKRVRVQTGGQLQGRVLMPAEYEIVEFL